MGEGRRRGRVDVLGLGFPASEATHGRPGGALQDGAESQQRIVWECPFCCLDRSSVHKIAFLAQDPCVLSACVARSASCVSKAAVHAGTLHHCMCDHVWTRWFCSCIRQIHMVSCCGAHDVNTEFNRQQPIVALDPDNDGGSSRQRRARCRTKKCRFASSCVNCRAMCSPRIFVTCFCSERNVELTTVFVSCKRAVRMSSATLTTHNRQPDVSFTKSLCYHRFMPCETEAITDTSHHIKNMSPDDRHAQIKGGIF